MAVAQQGQQVHGTSRRVCRGVAVAAQSALHAVECLLGALAGLLLAMLLAWVALAVALRYGLGRGLPGADELAIWLHLGMIALAAPLALGSALSMRLDLLRQALPPAGQAVCDVLGDALTLLSGLVIAFGTLALIGLIGGHSPALGLPEWLRLALFVPAGLLVVAVVALRRLAEGRWAVLLGGAALAALFWWGAPAWQQATPLPVSLLAALIAALGLLVAAPLPHAFLAAVWLVIPLGSTLPEPALVNHMVNGMSKFLLLAIPFFLLAGTLLAESGVAARLVRFAAAMVGHWRGGLAQTTLCTSVLFSGASGSSVANAAFGTATFFPELVRRGYAPERAGAIIAATAVLDNVIPPSIAFLILAAATQLSVGRLLVGGVFAGLVMALCLAVAFRLTARETAPVARASAAERRRAAWAALPAFGLGLIVVFGIRLGIVTTTEAAALAALYTLVLGAWCGMGLAPLAACLRRSAAEAAAIGMLIGTAGPFAFLLAVDGIGDRLAQLATALGGTPALVLLACCLILLVVGLVLDIGAAVLLLAPLLLPVAVQAGIDPIAFGVIVVVALMIGGLTPPVGLLVFVVGGISGVPARRLFRAGWPYLLALLIALALLAAAVVWLPPFF